MSNKNSNFPTNQLGNIPVEDKQEIINCIMDLAKDGKPQSVEELKMRLDNYFNFCRDRGFRCGIESLCLALGVSRVTFWNWCRGDGCSLEWSEQCQRAKQITLAFIEQASLSGRLNPPVAIFLSKNWGGYKDTVSFEESTPHAETERLYTLEDIKRSRLASGQNSIENGIEKAQRFKLANTENE